MAAGSSSIEPNPPSWALLSSMGEKIRYHRLADDLPAGHEVRTVILATLAEGTHLLVSMLEVGLLEKLASF